MNYVTQKQRPATGLYPNYINPDTGSWGSSTSCRAIRCPVVLWLACLAGPVLLHLIRPPPPPPPCADEVSLGALGDSFYEYLIKEWVFEGGRTHGRKEGREAFDSAMKVYSLSADALWAVLSSFGC